MSSIALSFLGAFQATVDEQPLAEFPTDKIRALLTYLALESARPHSRASLAAILWPQLSTEYALDNLRKSLYRLHQTLKRSAPHVAPPLAVAGQNLHFVAPQTTVDVHLFQSLLAETQLHQHPAIAECEECLARLSKAAEMYKGELLAGFGLSDAPEFEEWLLLWRESLHQQALLALMTLSKGCEARADLSRAHLYAGRLLQLDPYHEEAHRQMMRLLSQMGMPQQALAHFAAFKQLMNEELGLETDELTTALAEQIRSSNDPGGRAPAEAGPSSLYHPLSNVPEAAHLYGRRHDAQRIIQWLTEDRCRLVALFGMGGIGKTTLAAATVHSVAGDFDIVLWRSLINAPPLNDTLSEWLKALSGDPNQTLAESFDAQMTQLLECLRARRCLLVLDNLESIFQANEAGQTRPEHQGYAQLMRSVAELRHQSCLLLTSREQPQGFARLEEDLYAVRSLHLEGLDVSAAQSMLHDRGLSRQSVGASSLVRLYSGNPLALKLVAETVLELFGGDIESFLAIEAVIFEDIRAVLDWQYERLTPLEKEILLWLAVEREPVTLRTLRSNLTPPRPASELLAALRGLQRRSLLEQSQLEGRTTISPSSYSQSEMRFALQNVLMEYLTDRLLGMAYQEIQQEKVVHLHSHALIQAQANEHVRQSQMRLILRPLTERLEATVGREETIHKIGRILAGLHIEPVMRSSYAAGCLLNLLLMLDADLTGYDFSRLPVWQADLRNANLSAVNFSGADLSHTYFADDFGLVNAVAYSPDGTLLAAATNNGNLRLWQTSTGRLLHIFQGYKGTIRSLAFSPNGELLASAGEDETVRLWKVANRTPAAADDAPFRSVLKGHLGRVTAVAFHGNGKILASGGIDRTIRLWDIATGAMTAVLHGHEDWVWALAFHPDGTILASGANDHSIRLWDLQTSSECARLTGHTNLVSGVAFDRSGARLVSSSYDGTLRLWDVASGQQLQTLVALSDEINAIAISPNGDFLACGSDDNLARIWDFRTCTLRHLLAGHDSDILDLAFSADGQTLVTGSVDQTIRLWDVATGEFRQQMIGRSQSISMLAHHPNGKVVASAHFDHVVRLWEIERGSIEQLLYGHTKAVHSVTISGDGAWLASGGDDQTILLWRLYDPTFSAMGVEEVGQINQGRAQRYLSLTSQHGRVASLAFNPDGAILASGGYGQWVCLWEVASGRLICNLPGHNAPVSGLQFSPDGSQLVTVSRGQNIRLWDVQNESLIQRWQGHRGIITTVTFTPDGKTLATGGSDGMICVWDVRVPTQPVLRATLSEHSEWDPLESTCRHASLSIL